MTPSVDEIARAIARERWALPDVVHVPIAAKEEADLATYIGRVVHVIVPGAMSQALLIEPYHQPTPDQLPIWQLPAASILYDPRHVWVHVDYREYRKAYKAGMPEWNNPDLVLDHVMNRRVARLKGFAYLRIVPISRGANSSSGGLIEKWSVTELGSPRMLALHKTSPARIQYGDLADIVKMLDMKTGGRFQDTVNDAQTLVTYPTPAGPLGA